MTILSRNIPAFLQGFKRAGGWYDEDAISIEAITDQGVGLVSRRAIAIEDSEELFRIPYNIVLSSETSLLKEALPSDALDSIAENPWAVLIIVMMWEESREEHSPWSWYLNSLPTKFSSPMFWTEAERKELEGTAIASRIGRDQADALYDDVVRPFLLRYPDVFEVASSSYSRESFHIQGSRISSRSFTLDSIPAGQEHDAEADSAHEDDGVIAMVPFADILNAQTGSNNARLLVSSDRSAYTMTAVKDIAAQQQIFNTYDDLPNAELLRKYGYVDIVDLPETIVSRLAAVGDRIWMLGNPNDEAVILGDEVLEAVKMVIPVDSDNMDRIDWWLEQDMDDSFSISLLDGIEPDLFRFARLLVSSADWTIAQQEEKLPSSRPNEVVARCITKVIELHLAKYPTTHDLDLVGIQGTVTEREKSAIAVRIGERRALKLAMFDLNQIISDAQAEPIAKRKKHR